MRIQGVRDRENAHILSACHVLILIFGDHYCREHEEEEKKMTPYIRFKSTTHDSFCSLMRNMEY